MNTDEEKHFLPPYLDFIYGHIYNNPKACKRADNILSCNSKVFFQYKTLIQALNRELNANANVLQLGISFGTQIEETAQRINSLYQYDILDICTNEIERATEKYSKNFKHVKIFHGDARSFNFEQLYDVVICFMLLSQVPTISKRKIINNALNLTNKGGKVIFIDWHNPIPCHPLRYFVRMYNRLNHPFIEKLWEKDINTFTGSNLRSQFSWRKSTYFGGMFQKCVATRKDNPLKTIQKTNTKEEEEENFFNKQYEQVVNDKTLLDGV